MAPLPSMDPAIEALGTGTLVIDSRPSGASVLVDGEGQGETPTTLRLPAGRHVVELSLAGVRESIVVRLAEGDVVTRSLDLRR